MSEATKIPEWARKAAEVICDVFRRHYDNAPRIARLIADAAPKPKKIERDEEHGIFQPASSSFADVNDFVHNLDTQFEDLQYALLGIACEMEKRPKPVEVPEFGTHDYAINKLDQWAKERLPEYKSGWIKPWDYWRVSWKYGIASDGAVCHRELRTAIIMALAAYHAGKDGGK